MEILGGKHYKTPDGEFVEMKSGTQYKIHVKNSHAYGKSRTYYCFKNIFQLITMSNWGENILSDFNGLLLLTALLRSC